MSHCMILVTCDTEEKARRLAGQLLEEKLAACVQIHPVTSVYTWENRVHTEAEFRMVIKTRSGLYPQIEHFILDRHGYEVPQVVRVPIDQGLEAYLNWIDENTTPASS